MQRLQGTTLVLELLAPTLTVNRTNASPSSPAADAVASCVRMVSPIAWVTDLRRRGAKSEERRD